jgi:hypothetical protein
MNIAIIEVYPNKTMDIKKMIDAHLRNSFILSKILNCDLLCTENDFLKALNKKYDVLILGYASGYAPFTLIKKIIDNNVNAKKFVLSNEYNIVPSVGGFKPYHLIANYEKIKSKGNTIINFSFLNLNLLLAKEPNQLSEKKYDCIYYGTFRVNRSKYFSEYLQKNIYLSTSIKNLKKFKHIKCNPLLIGKLSWEEKKETLNLFRYSLYIEDNHTHNVFNNLANRWYEAGFCNNVVFFDVNCWNTIRKSEIAYFEEQIKNYIVSSHEELQAKIEYCNQDFERHLSIQKGWRLNQMVLRQDMINELKRIIENRD